MLLNTVQGKAALSKESRQQDPSASLRKLVLHLEKSRSIPGDRESSQLAGWGKNGRSAWHT